MMKLTMPDDCDAGAGRRLWLGANITPAESVVDLGGVGTMMEPWHPANLVTCLDDLSGFGPGHHYYGTLHRGDIQAVPFPDQSFDVAVMAEVLEHVPRPIEAIREAVRVAKRLLITTPYEHRWTNGNRFRVPGHVRIYTPDIFAAQLRAVRVPSLAASQYKVTMGRLEGLAPIVGEWGILEFGTWAFFVAVIAREGSPRDAMAERMAHAG